MITRLFESFIKKVKYPVPGSANTFISFIYKNPTRKEMTMLYEIAEINNVVSVHYMPGNVCRGLIDKNYDLYVADIRLLHSFLAKELELRKDDTWCVNIIDNEIIKSCSDRIPNDIRALVNKKQSYIKI